MTLRKHLFWLFLSLLMLVLLVVTLRGEHLLLPRLDQEDRLRLRQASAQLQSGLEHQGRYLLSRLDAYALRLVSAGEDAPAAPVELDFILRLEDGQPAQSLFSRLPIDAEQLAADVSLTEPSISLGWWREQPLMLLSVPLPNDRGQLLAGQRLDPTLLLDALHIIPEAELQILAPHHEAPHDETLPSSSPVPAILMHDTGVASTPTQLHTELHLHTPQVQDGLRLVLSLSRQAYLQGKQVLDGFIGWILATCAGALLLAWLGVEVFLLRRVRFMHREIASIGLSTQASRLTRLGRDELGELGHALNHMLDRLDSSESRDQAILDSIDDGYFEIEAEGRILIVSRGLECQLGFAAKELQGRNLVEIIGATELQRLRQQFRQAIGGKVAPRFVVPIQRRNGSTGYFETRVSLIRDANGRYCGLRGILHDIGDQVAFQEQLYDLAHRDPLTGLGNRMAFTEQLHYCCDEAHGTGRSLALLYLDLDRFKEVNDRYGHATGDALLVAIAERMHGAVRQPDLLYRLGGDEFTLLLPDSDADKAVRIAQRLHAALAQPYVLCDQRIDFVLPSIGIALYPHNASTPDALINAADEAMYQAKLDSLGHCVSQLNVAETP
ncbi:MAG TPA: diguanylate cyclase [Pseudomonas sp.]|nr:diguanylate cyclase [Pseudomonas sp.]